MLGLRVIAILVGLIWVQMSSAQSPGSDALVPSDVYCSLTDHDGYMWIGTKNGLLRSDGYMHETFRSDRNHPDFFRSNDILTIGDNISRNELWIGTKNGAFILSKDDYTVRDLKIHGGDISPDELANKRINHILSSRDSTMWVSYRNNIFHLASDGTLLNHYFTSWNGTNRSVVITCEDSKGNIWASLWNGGIIRIEHGSDHFIPCTWTDPEYPSELDYDKANHLIVASTTSGKKYYYKEDGSPTSALRKPMTSDASETSPPLPSIDETALCHYTDGESILIGTSKNIYSYNTSTQKLDTLLVNVGRVHGICTSHDGTIYFVSNSEGVCSVCRGKVSHLADSRSYSGITIDGDTTLYISSKLGNVFRLPLRTPYHLVDDTIAGNLNGDPVLTLVADQRGRLYILSSDLLKEYSPRSGGYRTLSVATAGIGRFSGIQLSDGGVVLTGSDGSKFIEETKSLGSARSIAKVAVSSFTLDGVHSILVPDTLKLDSSCRALSLFLTSFTYDQPHAIIFAYRQNGGDWAELSAGENVLTLSPLPYGRTVIEVKARDPYGQWTKAYKVMEIVHPRPWYAWLWIPLLAAIAICGVILIYRRRLKEKTRYSERIRRYEAEKDLLEQKLREAEDAALKLGYKDDASKDTINPDTLSPSDRKLIEDANRLVMENLTNMEYNVDALSSDLCMSRMNLYRKMHGAIGKSPTDFIRDIRLEQASMLLKTTNYSINEISDLTGFSYSSYFTKCFKDKYGKSPKEYRWK